MGARDLSRALSGRRLGGFFALAAAALAPRAAAQNRWPNDPAQRAHADVVFAERAAGFFAAWDAAEPARRDAAAERVAAAPGERAPAGAWPGLDDVAAATRLLAGGDADDALARFADTLDLQVVPGAFAPAREGRGAALTVRVYRAGEVEPPGDVRLSLLWIAPDGAETSARSEPITAPAFETPGFPMYVRAPLSGPGTWRLVPEVERAGQSARGPGVEVACVAAVEARVAALDVPGAERLRALLELGMRPLAPEGLEALLARCERGAAHAAPGFAPADAAPPRAVLAFLAVPGEAPGGFLLGPVGERWRAVARRRGLALLALPPEPDGAALDAALAELGIAERPERVVLVARGVAATSLALQPGAARLADALVESGPFAAPPASLAGAPALIVRDAAAGALPLAPAPAVTSVAGARTSFLSEPLLPESVEEWLSTMNAEADDR